MLKLARFLPINVTLIVTWLICYWAKCPRFFFTKYSITFIINIDFANSYTAVKCHHNYVGMIYGCTYGKPTIYMPDVCWHKWKATYKISQHFAFNSGECLPPYYHSLAFKVVTSLISAAQIFHLTSVNQKPSLLNPSRSFFYMAG